MVPIEKIKMKPASYKGYEHVSGQDEVVELYSNHLKYTARAKGKRMNEDLGILKDTEYDIECILIKNRITAIDFGWSGVKESYEMEIHPSGLVFVFNSKEEGEEVKSKIWNWLTT